MNKYQLLALVDKLLLFEFHRSQDSQLMWEQVVHLNICKKMKMGENWNITMSKLG